MGTSSNRSNSRFAFSDASRAQKERAPAICRGPEAESLAASGRFSANHSGGRSRATHVRCHPNIRVRTHIFDAKAGALRRQEPERHKPAVAYKRLSVRYKPGLHRPVVPRIPVALPELRTHRQVPPNQRPVLRSRNPESNKPAPMRSPPKIPEWLLRERELYSSQSSSCCVAARTLTRTAGDSCVPQNLAADYASQCG